MTTLVDTAPIVAAADPRDPRRDDVLDCLFSVRPPLVVPAAVAAETDYLLGRRVGREARLAFLEDCAAGAFQVAALAAEEFVDVLALERRYAALDLGLADCSLIVLAARLGTTDIVTFDERHFRTVEPLQGGEFRLLPADLTA